ncbi:MAG: FKBP-type peptidyl-prolyl cis-trans isomerase [Gemmatimonadota bacterium]
MMRILSRSRFVAIALLAACAKADTKAATDTTAVAVAPAPVAVAKDSATLETISYAPALNIDLAASTKLPSGMYIRDLKVGKGPAAKTGMQVSANYAVYFTDGKLIETNDKGPPITFTLGTQGIIAGWNEGLVGMKVGGTRQLIVPSALAYGQSGRGEIGPNTPLFFTVELLGAK